MEHKGSPNTEGAHPEWGHTYFSEMGQAALRLV